MKPPQNSIPFNSATDFPALLQKLLHSTPKPVLYGLFAHDLVQIIKAEEASGASAIDFVVMNCEGEGLEAFRRAYPDIRRPEEMAAVFGYFDAGEFHPQWDRIIEWHQDSEAKGGPHERNEKSLYQHARTARRRGPP
jgi:hypothetical protein